MQFFLIIVTLAAILFTFLYREKLLIRHIQLFNLIGMLAILSVVAVLPAKAQAVTWSQGDVGTTGVSGTYSFASGTHTVGGGGTGIGGTSDNFCFVQTRSGGNVEITGKVNTQTNTSAYAQAGFMVRSSLNANAANAFVYVSPSNGLNFSARTADGGTTATTLGPSVSVPVFLRLVVSGSSVAGYQSTDGMNWSLVGQTKMTLPNTFYLGFAVDSNVSGTLSTATFNTVVLMSNVPQRSSSMALWLRSDAGLQYSGSTVTGWLDQSGNGLNATQTTSANRPSLVTAAINGLPAVGFSGTNQHLVLPSGFANFTNGASIFVVTKPTSYTASAHFVYFGTDASGTNSLILQQDLSAGAVALTAFNGASASAVSASGALTSGQYQLLEATDTGGGSPVGTIFTNGTQMASGSLYGLNNVTRTNNYIGGRGTSYTFAGQIAEIIVFSRALSAIERADVEAYIYGKFGIGASPQLSAPVISPKAGVFATSQAVSISGPPGSSIFITTDGTNPTTSSTLYSGPVTISSTTTLKAIAACKQFQHQYCFHRIHSDRQW